MPEIVLLDGGLGNNLFQLRYAWGLKSEHPSKDVLLLALRQMPMAEKNFIKNAADELDVIFTDDVSVANKIINSIAHFKRMLSEKKLFTHKRNKFAITKFRNCRVHCGYWQSVPLIPTNENRFDDVLSKLLEDGSRATPILHIRGGDYHTTRNAAIYNNLGAEYYLKALEEIKRTNSTQDYKVVSNDPSYVRHLLSASMADFTFIQGGGALEDFAEISRHKIIVCSNSTFCWWAARLGIYKGQTDMIITPHHWLNVGYRHRSHPKYSESSKKHSIGRLVEQHVKVINVIRLE